MGGISVGGGGSGKKSVNSEIPLIPFIDLLLCCVMFLLVTAVWNQLAQLEINQQQPGQPDESPIQEQEERVKLILQINSSGYVLGDTAGVSHTIPLAGESYDRGELRTKLDERKRTEPNREDIILAPDDGVRYEDVIHAMDEAVGAGFPQLSIQPQAGL